MARTFNNIIEFERWLRDEYIPIAYTSNSECCGIFSPEGSFERRYEKFHRIILTPAQENYLRGKILSHNHPSSSTFSCSDVLVWANLHMIELRVVTELWTYSIKSINRTWPSPESIFEEIRMMIFPRTQYEFDTNGRLREECFQLLATKGLFEYSRISP